MICFEISPLDVEVLTRCPLCTYEHFREVSRVRHASGTEFLATAMCMACGFVFRHLRPTKEWFSRAFAERECLQSKQGISAVNSQVEKERFHRYSQLGQILAAEPAQHAGPREILDIGCGPGTGLGAFQHVGFVTTGVDEDNTRASYGIAIGLDIAVTPWEAYVPRTQYDFITCLHSIEHFHEPRRLLEQLRDWLKPGGKVIIEVPNLRYFVTDWTDALYLAHMANYTPGTLHRLGESTGFTPAARLAYYDTQSKNNQNLCMSFSLGMSHSPHFIKASAEDEPDWDWLATTYGIGLEPGTTPPYVFDVPVINDISLTYKNSTEISADLRKNLHMRATHLNLSTGRHALV